LNRPILPLAAGLPLCRAIFRFFESALDKFLIFRNTALDIGRAEMG
jgi:hypothetical protein